MPRENWIDGIDWDLLGRKLHVIGMRYVGYRKGWSTQQDVMVGLGVCMQDLVNDAISILLTRHQSDGFVPDHLVAFLAGVIQVRIQALRRRSPKKLEVHPDSSPAREDSDLPAWDPGSVPPDPMKMLHHRRVLEQIDRIIEDENDERMSQIWGLIRSGAAEAGSPTQYKKLLGWPTSEVKNTWRKVRALAMHAAQEMDYGTVAP